MDKSHFPKLNGIMTKLIKILSDSDVESKIIPGIQTNKSGFLPRRGASVKILGVIFADRLNLEKYINRVVRTY